MLAPGCKTGEMARKRWPYFPALAEVFDDVVTVGTAEDLCDGEGKRFHFPAHTNNLAGQLSLRETAEVIAAAGAFVGNDSGLSHIAAAVGTPTVMIFGPTSELVLGSFPTNVRIIRRGLCCEPCWFNGRFRACSSRIDCLAQVTVERVVCLLAELGFRPELPDFGSQTCPLRSSGYSCPLLQFRFRRSSRALGGSEALIARHSLARSRVG